MMTPRQISEDRGVGSSPHFRHTPLQIIHVIGNFLRIWSVYSMYSYFSQTGASVVLFIFTCLIPSSILFLALQKPWKGRALSNQQVVPSVINGVITALYFILWGKGLKSCGPVRAILAEYSGAVLGVLSAALYGRRGHIWKKIGGLIAMLASFYFLSQGWAMATYSPFYILDQTEEVLGMGEMVVPILAGILSALRRVIARRVSLKNQLKRRLNAITITSATCFLFPVAMWDFITGSTSGNSVQLPFSTWAFLSTTLFGVILIFYIDSIAEERLHMVFSSPRHLMVAGGCIIVMEIVYKMDFSLPGFIICSLLLGFGIYEATALERGKKGSFQESDPLTGVLEDQVQMSPLPT
ncbi:zinc transporter [Salix suchowensis]|nr:zinc transporter [Salix suchowensis]